MMELRTEQMGNLDSGIQWVLHHFINPIPAISTFSQNFPSSIHYPQKGSQTNDQSKFKQYIL